MAENVKEKIRKKATGLRIGAVILWVLAIGCEVLAIYLLNNVTNMTYLYIAIAVDAVLCIIGALLWKRANRLAPCKSDNKLVKFLWDQMGVIACLIAFIPFGLFLLNNKEIDSKTKKTLAAVAGVLFLGTMGASIDYNPVEPGDIQNQEAMLEEIHGDIDTVYWTEFGKSYHVDPNCQHIRNSENVYSGTLEEAFEAKKEDPCDTCVGDLYSGNDTEEDDPTEDTEKSTEEADAESEVEEAPDEGEEEQADAA